MKIKKYEGRTEQEAIEKVRLEMGLEAVILSIKKTQPKGIFALFRRPLVEVTAAFDEKHAEKQPEAAAEKQPENYFENRLTPEKVLLGGDTDQQSENSFFLDHIAINQQKEKIKQLEQKLADTSSLLEKAVTQLSVAEPAAGTLQAAPGSRRYDNTTIQMFYDTLLEQGVTPEIAAEVLDDLSQVEDDTELTAIVAVVYNKIMSVLGSPKEVNVRKKGKGKPMVFTFMGPTGVGKTTTIAKLSSQFKLNDGMRVAFITADTYRIAAVEQLKTYADILGIDIGVIYNNADLTKELRTLGGLNDIIMIDTAGRSHQNADNIDELKLLMSAVKKSENFLLLSAATKYEDLLSIVETYSEFTDFGIIFTKLDETACMGTIFNICYMTGKPVAYLTTGQNVPDDIEKMRPEKIARALLGLGGYQG